MPVPKSKQKLYGKIVGANINRGKSLSESKDIADAAITPGSQRPSKSRLRQNRSQRKDQQKLSTKTQF